MVGEQKAEGRADGDQPAARRPLDVAHDGDEEDERADHGEDVVADVAALVEERGRDEEEGRCCQRAPAPQVSLTAEEDRQRYQDHAEERGAEAAGGIGGAEKGVDQRIHVEEEGAVHQGVVGVVLPGGEEPGEVGVQALVMVQRPRPEIPEAGQHRGQEDQRVESRFEGESDGRRDPSRCHGRLRRHAGDAVVAHRERPAAVAVSGDVARRERGLIVMPGISIVPRHSLGRRYRLSHAGVPQSDERAPRAGGAPGEYTMRGEQDSRFALRRPLGTLKCRLRASVTIDRPDSRQQRENRFHKSMRLQEGTGHHLTGRRERAELPPEEETAPTVDTTSCYDRHPVARRS